MSVHPSVHLFSHLLIRVGQRLLGVSLWNAKLLAKLVDNRRRVLHVMFLSCEYDDEDNYDESDDDDEDDKVVIATYRQMYI